MNKAQQLATFFKERQILLGILVAVVAACVMTVVSMRLYDIDDVSRLDVSLPNRESIRSSGDEEEVQNFAASGALDSKAMSDFQKLYDKNRAALDALGKFDSDVLSDDSLQIGTNE